MTEDTQPFRPVKERASRRPKRSRFLAAAAIVALAVTLATSACSILPGSGGTDAPTPGDAESHAATPKAAPSPADALAGKVRTSLTKLGKGTASPSREQMKAAMLAAGAPAHGLEVSMDRTPTGLAVDAIQAAALLGKECVVGQVRDGKAAVVVLPVLATGRCFIGDPMSGGM